MHENIHNCLSGVRPYKMNHYVFITLDLAYRSIYKEINFLFIFLFNFLFRSKIKFLFFKNFIEKYKQT